MIAWSVITCCGETRRKFQLVMLRVNSHAVCNVTEVTTYLESINSNIRAVRIPLCGPMYGERLHHCCSMMKTCAAMQACPAQQRPVSVQHVMPICHVESSYTSS